MSLKSVVKRRVVHLGWAEGFELKLRPSDASGSYEGVGLSVMDDDEEIIDVWRSVARLDGDEIRLVPRSGQGRFVVNTRALETEAMRWAQANGWASPAKLWRVYYTDSESGDEEERFLTFRAKSEAQAEAKFMKGEGPRVEPADSWAATPKLSARWKSIFHDHKSETLEDHYVVIESVNLFLAAEHSERYDGVWWNDRFEPERLSAPRGVILPHAFERWTAAQEAGARALGATYGWRK